MFLIRRWLLTEACSSLATLLKRREGGGNKANKLRIEYILIICIYSSSVDNLTRLKLQRFLYRFVIARLPTTASSSLSAHAGRKQHSAPSVEKIIHEAETWGFYWGSYLPFFCYDCGNKPVGWIQRESRQTADLMLVLSTASLSLKQARGDLSVKARHGQTCPVCSGFNTSCRSNTSITFSLPEVVFPSPGGLFHRPFCCHPIIYEFQEICYSWLVFLGFVSCVLLWYHALQMVKQEQLVRIIRSSVACLRDFEALATTFSNFFVFGVCSKLQTQFTSGPDLLESCESSLFTNGLYISLLLRQFRFCKPT